MIQNVLAPFDAVILMSFGGPNKPEDVLPFLQNVTRGRGIPDERLAEVGEHYYGFDGKSPINEQNLALLSALKDELTRRGIDTPILWGNRNWDPYLSDVVREHTRATGAKKYLAVVTSAYSSYSSDRQYREDFAASAQALAEEGIEVEYDKTRVYFNHPGFADTQVEIVSNALEDLRVKVGELDAAKHRVLFVTHSIPNSMQAASEVETDGYQAQHEQLMDYVKERLGDDLPLEYELVYCSRSGAAHIPWLEPDVNDRLEELKGQGIEGVIVVPIGFVSDHMEVKYDLDTEARETAAELDMAFVRAASVGTHPRFVAGLVELLAERAAQVRGETPETPAVTSQGALVPGSGACSVDCCRGKTDKCVMPDWGRKA